MTARALLGAVAALVLGAAAPGAAHPLDLVQRPVSLAPGDLAPGVAVAQAWALSSEDRAFGGLSGLEISGDRVSAVSDRGHIVQGRIAPAEEAPLSGLSIRALTDAAGRALTGRRGDAEGLAERAGALHVSFEHDHRIARLDAARVVAPVVPAGAADLPGNDGLEALAALPGGQLIAIAEARGEGGFPVWTGPQGGPFARAHLPALSRHAVTGADATPGGWLFVVFRHWSPVSGISIRVRAYPPGPDFGDARHVAAFGPRSGIDNMEGIAVAPGREGRLDLWLLSDDNFNAVQRSLLVRLTLPAGQLQDLPPASIE